NNRCTRFEQPTFFRISNYSVGRSIFNGSTRIHEFRLSQNLTAGQFGQTSQSNQRRISNVSINPRIFRSHVLNPFLQIVKSVLSFSTVTSCDLFGCPESLIYVLPT